MSSASIEDLGRTAGSWLDQVSVTMGEVTVMMLVMMMILMMTDEHKVMKTAMKILNSDKPAAQSILQHMSLVQLRG